MAESIRTWEDMNTGNLTLEVVDDFGMVIEKHVVTQTELEDMRTRGVRILREQDVLEECRRRAPARPLPPPAPPSAPPPAPVAAPAPPPPTPGGGPVTADPAASAEPRPKRSCLTCPSFRATNAVPNRYSRVIGTPMCDFYDKPLGRTNRSSVEMEKTFEKVGTACPDFGKPAASKPRRTFKIAFPDMRLMGEPIDDNKKQAVQTCASCKNFTPSDIVASELGWVAGLCNAKGELIQDLSTTFVGKTCDIRQFGENRKTAVVGLNLFPEYADDFLTGDLIAEFKKANAFDPTSFDTDAEVSDEDKACGIKGWREITDKERPNEKTGVFLPIFDPEFFEEVERSKIPMSGDDEHPELYVDHSNAVYKVAVCWTALDETPAVWGEAGNGKTELFRYLAWMMGVPFERLSITASTELDDLAGKMHYDPAQGTYFEPGRLPRAYTKPCILVIDEPNVGPPDVWQFLRPLTDNSKQLVLDMNKGERINRHAQCFMGMAMNPAWDPRNVGAAPIGDADQRRLMHIFMNPPPKEIEEEIIKQRCLVDGYDISKVKLNALSATAEVLRGLSAQQALPITWGVAPQIKVARATRWFSMIDAYRIAVTDYLEPSQAEMVLDAVRQNTPDSLIGGASAAQAVMPPWM